MNALNTYWLCRAPGSATEGPFTIGQLRKMQNSGAITADAQVCRHGEEEWSFLGLELEMLEMESAPVLRHHEPERPLVKRRRGQKNGCVSGFLFLIGLAGLLFFWPVGLLIILVALIMDHVGCYWMCGSCRNEVAPKARMCPACKAHLKGGWF